MRLEPDCIRDILLAIELESDGTNYLEFGEDFSSECFRPVIATYGYATFTYHVSQCEQRGLITKISHFMGGSGMVQDLTPDGHDFIANIRSEANWNTVKARASVIGSFALDVLTTIAAKFINERIG